MPACPRDLLSADDTPHGSTGVRNDLREFLLSRAAAHNRERTTTELFESDGVFHANSPYCLIPSLVARPADEISDAEDATCRRDEVWLLARKHCRSTSPVPNCFWPSPALISLCCP